MVITCSTIEIGVITTSLYFSLRKTPILLSQHLELKNFLRRELQQTQDTPT
jgi:hypothetical protein